MRLIDADALMEKLNGIWDCNDMTFAPVDGCCIDADCKSCRWRETIEYVKRLVQNQPTVSPWVSGCDCHQYDVSTTSNLDWTHHSTNTLEQIMKGTYKPPKEDA